MCSKILKIDTGDILKKESFSGLYYSHQWDHVNFLRDGVIRLVMHTLGLDASGCVKCR